MDIKDINLKSDGNNNINNILRNKKKPIENILLR